MPIRMLPNAAGETSGRCHGGQGAMPVSCRIAGFTTTMYAMVMNVVRPANASVRQFVPRRSNSK